MERFQKFALAALVALLVLILAGAVVRVTGAGLGCPDWPKCWGCFVPPKSVDEIDFASLDERTREKFYRQVEQSHGLSREEMTAERIKSLFNPVHAWTEYINRLLATPVALTSLLLFIAAHGQLRRRPKVYAASLSALLLVVANALLGARVVSSGLTPGVITAHLALAQIMLFMLVYAGWAGTDSPWRRESRHAGSPLGALGISLLVLTLVEGIMGAQVRELTDELARTHAGEARSEWTAELEGAGLYLAHRSFSWLIFAGTLGFLWLGRRDLQGGLGWLEKTIGALVFALMVMGVVLSQVGVLPVVQAAHVLAASILLVALILWVLAYKSLRA